MSGSVISMKQKSTTFKCEWTTSSYNTKSELFSLENDNMCCVGVKHNSRLNRYVLYFVARSRYHVGFEIVDVFFTTHQAATRLPMLSASIEGSTRVFSYEMVEWKTPVTCTFWVSVEETVDTYLYQLGDTMMAEQLWKAANDQLFTDVEFHVAGRIFSAHKAIVANRSPVLQAMFRNDMTESRTNQVKIDDVNAAVFKRFLRFLYTGRIDTCHDELFAVADKYQVETLRRLCQLSTNELDASELTSLVMSL